MAQPKLKSIKTVLMMFEAPPKTKMCLHGLPLSRLLKLIQYCIIQNLFFASHPFVYFDVVNCILEVACMKGASCCLEHHLFFWFSASCFASSALTKFEYCCTHPTVLQLDMLRSVVLNISSVKHHQGWSFLIIIAVAAITIMGAMTAIVYFSLYNTPRTRGVWRGSQIGNNSIFDFHGIHESPWESW